MQSLAARHGSHSNGAMASRQTKISKIQEIGIEVEDPRGVPATCPGHDVLTGY